MNFASFYGTAGVFLGAFGAHGLKKTLEKNGHMDVWKTGVQYHLLHSVVLLALALMKESQGKEKFKHNNAVWWFRVGTTLFSGSLYSLCLGAPKKVGIVTPIGGLCLCFGWLRLSISP